MAGPQQFHSDFLNSDENLASFTSYLKLVSVSKHLCQFLLKFGRSYNCLGVYGGAHFFPDQQLGGLGETQKNRKVDELIVSCIFLLCDRRN